MKTPREPTAGSEDEVDNEPRDRQRPIGDRPTLDDALHDAIDQARADHASQGRDLDSFDERLDDTFVRELVDKLTGPVYASLRVQAPELAKKMAEDETALQDQLKEVWGPPDTHLRAVIYLAHEIGSIVARSSEEQSAQLRALLVTHGRAVRVASEVRHLALSGYALGATARWRTLYELDVVVSVLANADDEVAHRYLDSDAIENLKDVQAYQRHAAALGRKPYSDEELRNAEAAADRVKERWGTKIGRKNGWALPLFPGEGQVTFTMLADLSGLGYLKPFYLLGNNHVHSGAKAARLNAPRDGSGPQRVGTGPTVMADIAETSHLTMINLHQATAQLVVAFIRDGGTPQLDLLVGISAMSSFVDDSASLWHQAVGAARDRGWFDHNPED